MARTFWGRFHTGMFAKEVLLFDGGEGSVCVGASDLSDLERVYPQLLLEFQSAFESRASVFPGQHRFRFCLTHVEIAEVPGLVIGELVIGRQKRMRFAVPFDLGRLVQGFPTLTCFGVLASDLATGKGLDVKHQAIAEVSVVRDR